MVVLTALLFVSDLRKQIYFLLLHFHTITRPVWEKSFHHRVQPLWDLLDFSIFSLVASDDDPAGPV